MAYLNRQEEEAIGRHDGIVRRRRNAQHPRKPAAAPKVVGIPGYDECHDGTRVCAIRRTDSFLPDNH